MGTSVVAGLQGERRVMRDSLPCGRVLRRGIVVARPDRVESGRVKREQPALKDAVRRHAIEPERGPVALDAVDGGGAVGAAGDMIVVADEQLARMHVHGGCCELSAAQHVGDDLVVAVVVAGDGVLTRNVPGDVGAEDVVKFDGSPPW